MPEITPVSEVMTRGPRTASVSDPLSHARRILSEETFHHLPIMDGDAVVGMLSSRDLVRVARTLDLADPDRLDESLDSAATIRESMTTELVTMLPDDTVDMAIDRLADGAVHSVLIVSEDARLVGIVTNVDLLEYLFG